MLVFTHKNARELGEALIEACDIIEGDSALELVTVEKFGPKFVVVENDECVDDTVVAITREKDKTSLQSNNITRARKFGNARG